MQALQTHYCYPFFFNRGVGLRYIMIRYTKGGTRNIDRQFLSQDDSIFQEGQRPESPESDLNHLTHRGGYR